MIDGVVVKPLKVIPDERGYLMEIFRDDDPFFRKFGQAYLTVVYPGVVKGWHYHKVQDDHFCVVKGMSKVVLYDLREGSPTKGEVNEFFMGEKNPILLLIPHGVLHGMKGVGVEPALLLNIPTEHYDYKDPDEYRVHPHDNDIPYDWERKDG
ncbi:MAG: dTDP-4-dehydrorhamnose 3,5-epimerase family protein [Candidatus Eisenbacteria bacterium]|nr:dTDP-4-dehydrorhamnose 3,5-epimerase family protein [Candidatus Eisenbacteria bacterium]MCC7143049.1 dTDP-4-dehydrorhamnose 3,5-epimerase family protein [Candidatus Eisenbacteria bacterium]